MRSVILYLEIKLSTLLDYIKKIQCQNVTDAETKYPPNSRISNSIFSKRQTFGLCMRVVVQDLLASRSFVRYMRYLANSFASFRQHKSIVEAILFSNIKKYTILYIADCIFDNNIFHFSDSSNNLLYYQYFKVLQLLLK